MAELKTRSADDPSAEILATSGLITMLGSVVAAVIAAVSLGGGNMALAGMLGAVAVLTFVSSLVFFAVDSNRTQEAPLPFPSWLRTDSEAAAELSA